ncbi:hypothetical protein [uncultured Lacinutrix sp.]|uniref:hypothetical protein n=1 Tax=uncultured Lacinutrix sp. TaxID=574032 RepID=UPI002602CABC|nr:hypothetical protein [uncultured Lacinutrix sp.]
MKYILFALFVSAIFISCKREVATSEIIEDYQIVSIKSGPENYRTIDSTRFKTFVETNRRIYEYASMENDSTYFYLFEKNINNDSVLKVIDVECKLVDSKKITFKNNEIILYKYSYNLIDEEDEEEDYYFSNEYGLIMSQSIAWTKANTLINEEEFKSIQDSILLNLYRFRGSYPPPNITESKN